MRILKRTRGESLTEVLAAALIVLMSAALLGTLVTSAVNTDISAGRYAQAVYNELSAAELKDGPSPDSGIALINNHPVDVKLYGKGDGALAGYGK